MISLVLVVCCAAAGVPGEPSGAPAKPADGTAAETAGGSDAEVVRWANEMLRRGQIEAALEAYRRVLPRHPNSSELAFDLGLGALKTSQFDDARKSFRKAALAEDSPLSTDALYALGATDHSEALALSETDPKRALELTQDALRRYHDVLERQPAHRGALDSGRKAAALWRALKQALDRQPPESSSDSSKDDTDESQDQQQQQDQQQDGSSKNDGQDSQQQQGQQQASSDANDNAASRKPQDRKDPSDTGNDNTAAVVQNQEQDQDQEQKQASQADSPSDDDNRDSDSAQASSEEMSRQEALRQLRRIMDRQRRHQQQRRRRDISPPPKPTLKDW